MSLWKYNSNVGRASPVAFGGSGADARSRERSGVFDVEHQAGAYVQCCTGTRSVTASALEIKIWLQQCYSFKPGYLPPCIVKKKKKK